MKRTKHTTAVYQTPAQLFAAHDAKTPSAFAQEAYDRTPCGVSTTFIHANGGEVCGADLTPEQDTSEWATRYCVGVKFGAIVEGSDAEFDTSPLMFPFTDKELAEAWDYLEEQTDDAWEP